MPRQQIIQPIKKSFDEVVKAVANFNPNPKEPPKPKKKKRKK